MRLVIQLIGTTTTMAGLRVNTKLDKKRDPTNAKSSDEEMVSVNLESHAFHGEWTYAIKPNRLSLPAG